MTRAFARGLKWLLTSFKVTIDNGAILYATYDFLLVSILYSVQVFKILSLTYQFIKLRDGLGRPSIDVDPLPPRRPALTLNFHLQNLIR